MTVKELAAKVEALEAEVAYLRGALAAKSQPIVVQPYQPAPAPYTVTYGGSIGKADLSSLRSRLRSVS